MRRRVESKQPSFGAEPSALPRCVAPVRESGRHGSLREVIRGSSGFRDLEAAGSRNRQGPSFARQRNVDVSRKRIILEQHGHLRRERALSTPPGRSDGNRFQSEIFERPGRDDLSWNKGFSHSLDSSSLSSTTASQPPEASTSASKSTRDFLENGVCGHLPPRAVDACPPQCTDMNFPSEIWGPYRGVQEEDLQSTLPRASRTRRTFEHLHTPPPRHSKINHGVFPDAEGHFSTASLLSIPRRTEMKVAHYPSPPMTPRRLPPNGIHSPSIRQLEMLRDEETSLDLSYRVKMAALATAQQRSKSLRAEMEHCEKEAASHGTHIQELLAQECDLRGQLRRKAGLKPQQKSKNTRHQSKIEVMRLAGEDLAQRLEFIERFCEHWEIGKAACGRNFTNDLRSRLEILRVGRLSLQEDLDRLLKERSSPPSPPSGDCVFVFGDD